LHIAAKGGAVQLSDQAVNWNLHDESSDINSFGELLWPVIFSENVNYLRWDVFQTNFYKSVFSLEYTYVNDLHGTTAQSEMLQEKRLKSKPTEHIACLIVNFVLNTWIFNVSEVFSLW